MKNADENELREIASEPDNTHVYNVAEFDLMHTVVESLTRTVCSRVEEQDREIKGMMNDREHSLFTLCKSLSRVMKILIIFHTDFLNRVLCAPKTCIIRVEKGNVLVGAVG